MKKRTLIAIVTATILGFTAKSLYKSYISPIFIAAKQWDDEHDLINISKANDSTVVSTLCNHYLKTPDGSTFLFLSNTRIDTKYPKWMMECRDEIAQCSQTPIYLSVQAMFTAKFAVVEHKLSPKEKSDFKALGIALFERPISLSQEQANLVKEKMISILFKATRK